MGSSLARRRIDRGMTPRGADESPGELDERSEHAKSGSRTPDEGPRRPLRTSFIEECMDVGYRKSLLGRGLCCFLGRNLDFPGDEVDRGWGTSIIPPRFNEPSATRNAEKRSPPPPALV